MRKYNLQNVTIDDQSFFSAYVVIGEDWNGFALPYFTLQEAKRICEYLNVTGNDEWEVVNLTDGIIATPVISKSEADNFIKEFSKKFKEQGYYLTSKGEKIKPEEVKLEIRPAEPEKEEPKARYDEPSDTFIIQELIEDEEYEPVEYSGENITVNGNNIHVYAVGAGSWIWSIATRLN